MNFDPRWDAMHRDIQWAMNPCEHLCRFVAGNFPASGKNLRALDLGCGAGAQSEYLGQYGFSVQGIDGSQAAIDRCNNRRIKLGFAVADMTALPFARNEFDLVVDVASFQCLERPDAVKSLAEVHRVLKPGGRFFSYTSRVGTSLEVHRGMPTRSMTRYEVQELYGALFDVRTVDCASFTKDNGAVLVNHWIIAARKA